MGGSSRTSNNNISTGLIAAGVAVAVLGFLFFGISSLSRQVANSQLKGVITEKEFIPQPETQLTIGRDGLKSRDIAGDYRFEVKVGERLYDVWIDKKTYDSFKVGDPFHFPPPQEQK